MRTSSFTYGSHLSGGMRLVVNAAIAVGSVLLCLLLLPTRFPGMELLGVAPNWMLIWVVAWSIKRKPMQGALAGVVLGLLLDAMTSGEPTHAVSLGVVGYLTATLQKQKYVQEDFISVALIVFGMSVLGDTIRALQFSGLGDRSWSEIWAYHQPLALASAILSSLWAPVIYFPLNRLWEKMQAFDRP
ncbi:rod shape-determining protein MreD [Laspinema olomoucense]|uniref:Rod shape-determining protein MreD n=1 Tax=Laspinema olomoucense D3b TaxID=2953688 RepID=A0ABT2N981_9CYAN|nr:MULTISPECIES: rod shape-determining protein MreD [unclassified Laspinema]MCT7975180.1 rod shape-determining protein MreD [Laspinema sp. D3d]MCT7979254.1 rod shape-determining protein MreD [Laspinema sp. D3b]MCT7990695.1 rod shape-determining protein MreD [Laspinema sp. D3a]MCT7996728.1 rod shape-determining protein MreD [Laspinema sp. D3c]